MIGSSSLMHSVVEDARLQRIDYNAQHLKNVSNSDAFINEQNDANNTNPSKRFCLDMMLA